MKIQRFPDWPERFAAFIEARRERAFSWGENDCALQWADAILEVTGVDVAAPWRGYKTERGALSRIKKAGGLRELVLSAGFTERTYPRMAQRVDGVLAILDGRETLGTVMGNGMWFGPGAERMEIRPMSEVIAVFEV